MHAMTIKVGETMETIENQKQSRTTKQKNTNQPTMFVRWGKDLVRSVARSFCYMALKLKLKDIGSSIYCEGKISIAGTKNIKIGNGCYFGKNVQLQTGGRGYIHLGEKVKIEQKVILNSTFNITVEDNTYIGEGVVIKDMYSDSEKEVSQKEGKPVYIGKDVWIGKGTQIHAGVTIGHGCTISANSVVLHSIPPRVIAGGSPAKVIKENGI